MQQCFLRSEEMKKNATRLVLRCVTLFTVHRSLTRPRVEEPRIDTAQEGAPELGPEREFGWTDPSRLRRNPRQDSTCSLGAISFYVLLPT